MMVRSRLTGRGIEFRLILRLIDQQRWLLFSSFSTERQTRERKRSWSLPVLQMKADQIYEMSKCASRFKKIKSRKRIKLKQHVCKNHQRWSDYDQWKKSRKRTTTETTSDGWSTIIWAKRWLIWNRPMCLARRGKISLTIDLTAGKLWNNFTAELQRFDPNATHLVFDLKINILNILFNICMTAVKKRKKKADCTQLHATRATILFKLGCPKVNRASPKSYKKDVKF